MTALHEWETVRRTHTGGTEIARLAVPGGWLYQDRAESPTPTVFVPDPTAPHCRPKVRWFALHKDTTCVEVDGMESGVIRGPGNKAAVTIMKDGTWEIARIFGPPDAPQAIAGMVHSREEAHDALGPDSPWVEVTE